MKLILILKINNSKEIKAIKACVLNKNKPKEPIKNKKNDNKKKKNIIFYYSSLILYASYIVLSIKAAKGNNANKKKKYKNDNTLPTVK